MLAWLERNPFLVVALAGALILSTLAARDVLAPNRAPVLVLHDGAGDAGAPIRVHVAGGVAAPGLYALTTGDRVADALALAGGALPGAILDAINLARPLRDGEQLYIESPPPPTAVALIPGQLLNINTATREELDALPGIGEAYSRRIVDSRTVDGPFATTEDVLARGLVPARTFEGIRSLISASPP